MKSRLRKNATNRYPRLPAGEDPELEVLFSDENEKKEQLKEVYRDFEDMLDQNQKERDLNLYTF